MAIGGMDINSLKNYIQKIHTDASNLFHELRRFNADNGIKRTKDAQEMLHTLEAIKVEVMNSEIVFMRLIYKAALSSSKSVNHEELKHIFEETSNMLKEVRDSTSAEKRSLNKERNMAHHIFSRMQSLKRQLENQIKASKRREENFLASKKTAAADDYNQRKAA